MSACPAIAVLVGSLVVAAATGPQQDAPARVEATLTVRLPAGKTTYAVGEVIPLELEFRGRAEPDYYLWTGTYDRSGRMGYETYDVAPESGYADPLAEYFDAFASPGGGLGGLQPLDGSPFLLSVHLNEWVRFTRAGDYRLVVTSHRLGRHSGGPAPEVVAPPLALRIESASPEWAAAEAARAVAAVARGESKGVTVLRHLGTREAALQLVTLHGAGGESSRFEVLAGLVASPHRRDVVEAMEARVDAGEALSPGFVRDLALVRSLFDLHSGASDPRARFDELRADECDYTKRWGRAIVRRGTPSDALAALLASRVEGLDSECTTEVAEILTANPAAARLAFLSLAPPTQATLLQHRWSALDGGWIQPALETLLEKWLGDSRFPGAGDWALKRIVELDRARGRSLLLEEVRTGAHGLTSDTLASLNEGPLPDLDGTLTKRFQAARSEEARANAMWLVAKYGSAGILPLVRSEIDKDPACALEAASLAYLLRHEPATAIRRLQPGFDRSRGGMCVVPPFGLLGPTSWDERVEDAAIAHARLRAPRFVLNAVQALQIHGSDRVKGALMDRLVEWEAEWRGRAKELDGPSDAHSPLVIENALVNALLDNPRIALTSFDRARLRALCVTRNCRTNVDARLGAPRGP